MCILYHNFETILCRRLNFSLFYTLFYIFISFRMKVMKGFQFITRNKKTTFVQSTFIQRKLKKVLRHMLAVCFSVFEYVFSAPVCPAFWAYSSGVTPSTSRGSGAAPATSSAFTHSAWPVAAAQWSGVLGRGNICSALLNQNTLHLLR